MLVIFLFLLYRAILVSYNLTHLSFISYSYILLAHIAHIKIDSKGLRLVTNCIVEYGILSIDNTCHE